MVPSKSCLVFWWLMGMLCVTASAQHPHLQWHFGFGAALEFTTGSPLPIAGSAMNTDEGCASLCDETGNLQFYTDGVTVWNRQHHPMPNGTGLFDGTSATQSALIVKARGIDSLYLLFTVAAQLQGAHSGLSYSLVDMRLENGLGDVVQKNTLLCDSTTEKLTAIRATNGSDVWVVTHRWKSDAFYAYRVTCAANGTPQVLGPVISHAGSTMGFDGAFNPTATSIGCMKISPDGRRLALVWSRYLNDTSPDSDASVEWFDFNAATGIVSQPAVHLIPGLRAYGCAFAPSSRYLYISTYGLVNGIAYSDIRQYDLLAANIPASETIVANSIPEFGTLQLGPDGKLYAARLSFSSFVSAFDFPDSAGLQSGFVPNAVSLGAGRSTWGLPNQWDHDRRIEIWAFQDTSICPWEQFHVVAGIPGALGWLWSNGNTDYDATLQDEGLVTVEVYLPCDTLRDSFFLHHEFCDPPFLPTRLIDTCDRDRLVLDASTDGAFSYRWKWGEETASIATADTGWIWVDVAFDHDTIRDSVYVRHHDCECVQPANVFSPNGDGANDIFQPRIHCGLEEYDLAVYDRWGTRLFQTKDPQQGWDGKLGQANAPETVYYYVVAWKQFAAPAHRHLGSLMLLR